MESTLQALCEVLAELGALHRQLLQEADAKRAAIVQGDLSGMESILEREKTLILAVEEKERTRQTLTATLQDIWSLPEPVKLAQIINRAEGKVADTLRTVHEELKRVLEQLRYRTRQNAELMKASMEHVDAFLRTVAEAAAPIKKGYGPDGRKTQNSASLLDRSV